MRKDRLYTDSSVIGGCHDAEFAEDSHRLIDAARKGIVTLLLSDVVIREIGKAPQKVQDILRSLTTASLEKVDLTTEVLELRNAYISAGILAPKWIDDATHVAAATVARADAIVSWNFMHIVRLDKIKAFNQVNLLHGYGILTIITPKEIRYDE